MREREVGWMLHRSTWGMAAVRLAPALFALLLLTAPGAWAQPAASTGLSAGTAFSLRNDTKSLIRCLLMEGGPITQLVAIRPGHTHVERIAPGQQVSLACPKLRTTFGPFAAGHYAVRSREGRTEITRLR